jgi:NAD(P) transhydrogenase subunit alpha
MRLAVLRERHPGEKRVGLSPTHVASLIKAGWEVRVESLAGQESGWDDEAYRSAGARVDTSREAALDGASCIVKVRPPSAGEQGREDEVGALPGGAVLVSFLSPGEDQGLLEKLAARRVSAMAMERVPRTTRAQRMDALSSQATSAGYRAVLLAALHLPRFLPMLTTAAGTVKPARVLVLGAGVAGLQAISTARRLGAVVQGYDIRPAAAEQVRSLGAAFLQDDDQPMAGAETAGGYARALETSEKDRQLAFLGRHVPKADAVLTMAQIPGRRAPLLVTRAMVEGMAPGSVVVDVAAETGGNCEVSVPGQTIVHKGVTIVAPTDLPSGVAQHSSQMYGTNVSALLALLVKDGALVLDTSDDIVASVLVTHEGAVRQHP